MNPDGFDDVRLLLRQADCGPLPRLDVEALLRAGERERRRHSRARWYAVAAVLLVVAAVGAGLLTLVRPEAAGPAGRGGSPTPSGTSSAAFAPMPQSPDQWLLYAQPAVDSASSVHLVELLAPGAGSATVDVVLSPAGADGTVTFQGVTSRYVAVGGVTYVEPAVLVKLGAIREGDAGTARWVRLGPPGTSRLRPRPPSTIPFTFADASRWSPTYAEPRTVDGVATTAIATNVEGLLATGKVQTFYLTTAAPHLPLLIELDGMEVARFSDWNAPVTTPVAPAASEVVDVPGL